jgi:hypothetical protein
MIIQIRKLNLNNIMEISYVHEYVIDHLYDMLIPPITLYGYVPT